MLAGYRSSGHREFRLTCRLEPLETVGCRGALLSTSVLYVRDFSNFVSDSSFSSGQTLREIVPLALADNGLRWHVRAYDRRGHRFVDFVLTRIHTVDELPSSTIAPHELAQHDLDWSRVLELKLVAHPKETHPEIVAMDYDMQQGVLKNRVRAALASYLLRQWLVDCTPDHSLKDTEYRLWLKNTPILYGIANAHLAPGYKP